MSDVVSIEQAYAATYDYLQRLYARTELGELGGLLSDMSLLEDGTTADPAAWADWLESIEKTKSGKIDARLRLR